MIIITWYIIDTKNKEIGGRYPIMLVVLLFQRREKGYGIIKKLTLIEGLRGKCLYLKRNKVNEQNLKERTKMESE